MTYGTINDAETMQGGGAMLAGRYRVVRQLGQGDTGGVWLAEDKHLDNKLFAIKMLPSILMSKKWAYRQLKDEALVAMKLTHPNIVTLRAFEENSGNPFLVMDYIDGVTLDDYLADYDSRVESVGRGAPTAPSGGQRAGRPTTGGLPEDDVIRILKPIAAALDYAHGEGILHRDINAANIIVRGDGHPFIREFGVTRQLQETMTRVTGQSTLGMITYMSPEQLKGDRPTVAQDVYSFAAIVYECLMGAPPFSRGQIDHQILNNTPPPLPSGIRIAPRVMKALSKMPEERPESCGALFDLAVTGVPVKSPRTVEHKAGDLKTVLLPGGVEMNFRWCPSGSFTMGSPLSEKGRDDDETAHQVRLSKGFWIGETAVTQRQWQCVMWDNPSFGRDRAASFFSTLDRQSDRREECPVDSVSWNDCQRFISRVNAAQSSFALRLPTEAEWEYACRAGTATAYCWGNTLNGDRANCDGRSPCGTPVKGRYHKKTQPVRSYPPNRWGLFEMHGNVHEWCADWYAPYAGDATDPSGPGAGEYRVFRGGSWYDRARYCRAAYRDGNVPELHSPCLGFRVICL